jgi:2-C-methyl-D-erythritol 4-phosphate cytidylyltransferase/2-C-methyl-D-erythritol 2,4-cyclodiphosphate synthase
MPSCTALIVAGGRGSRFGGTVPKQYALLEGEPVIRRTIFAVRATPGIHRIQVVIGPGDKKHYADAVAGLDLPPPVEGGPNRQRSVLNGLEALAAEPPDLVAIHDAARPFVRPEDIAACLDRLAAPGIDGAVLGVPLADTLKKVEGTAIVQTVPRAQLWRAQTPQAFRYALLLAAHRAVATLAAHEATAMTDDAAVAEHAGLKVVMVQGHDDNRKITTADDLQSQAALETRTAFGFDVHGFGPGDSVMLGGIAIPHSQTLAGHSDADVALHALTDAVLGTIGAGDIGQHFPPSDPQWRGVSSDRFLRYAVELLQAAGGRIVHLDLTLVCQAPRIGPHREAMAESIARIAGVTRGRVSVKATTTEGLGFTGRGEGIAAQAVATVELPRRR